jgi:bacillithiol system protein YtxJ
MDDLSAAPQRDFDTPPALLETPEAAEDFLKTHPCCAVFKAGGCQRTEDALAEVRSVLTQRNDIPMALVRVITARAASNHIAARTGVRHQSPQLLLIKDGRVVFARDNWELSAQAIAEALETHFRRP